MKFGLHSVNLHSCGDPETAARLARAAEAAGFESLWVADHVVLPDPPMPQRPMAPDMRLLDPVVMLTFYAALTTRIRLATGVIVKPAERSVASGLCQRRVARCREEVPSTAINTGIGSVRIRPSSPTFLRGGCQGGSGGRLAIGLGGTKPGSSRRLAP